jgi:hypothetical protein
MKAGLEAKNTRKRAVSDLKQIRPMSPFFKGDFNAEVYLRISSKYLGCR